MTRDRAFYTYIVQCSDGSLYAGWTTDINRRLKEHNSGQGARYTRGRGPVLLRASWQFATKEEAMKFEWQLKRCSRKEKLMHIAASASDVCRPQGLGRKV